jgi:hypothetical protein
MAIRSTEDLKRLTEAEHSILVFIAITYAQSLALSFVIGFTGGYRSKWIGLGFISMLIPRSRRSSQVRLCKASSGRSAGTVSPLSVVKTASVL